MHPTRPAPVGAYLAIAGALIAVGSLVLPWFSIDPAGLATEMNGFIGRMGGPQDAATQAQVAATAEEAKVSLEPQLLGYRDAIGWVVTRVLIAAGLVVAALKVLGGDESGVTQRRVFLGGAVAFALRPVIYLFAAPSHAELRRMGIDFADITTPATGIYVAMIGAVLLVGAAMLAHVGDEEASGAAAPLHVPSPVGAHVPAAYMPGGPKSAASAPTAAYVPSGPPMAAAAPTAAYVPPGPPTPRPAAHAHPQPGSAPQRPAAPAPRPHAAPAAFATMAAPTGPTVPGPTVGGAQRAGGSVPPPGVF